MGANSSIEWTDHTFNAWWGCARVSPGCEHCYAERFAKRKGVKWGVHEERRTFGDEHWREPVRWNARAARRGRRYRVFCASMADVFDEHGPESERARLWDLIARTPHLDWQLLTKRPQHFERFLPRDGWPWRNVWLGVTAEDQRRADERIPILVRTPAAVRFISYEPALGPVDVSPFADGLDWLIAGGESGAGARPMSEDWVRGVRDQCAASGIAFFYKQRLDGKLKIKLPVLDGAQHAAFPHCQTSG